MAVARDKFARGLQPGREDAPEVYVVRELRDALLATYSTDAHLVTYLVEGATRQPRINKLGLPLVGKRVTVEVFFCDVDNDGHASWTQESFAAARHQDHSLPSLTTAGVYYTLRGRRIVQPLATPLAIDGVERQLQRWLTRLETEGLAVDWACRDWTRHFRLPHARRELSDRSPCVDLDRMVPLELEPLPPLPVIDEGSCVEPARRSRVRTSVPQGPLAWTSSLPERWKGAVEKIAAAIGQVTSEWHSLFLALAGALLSRQVPPEHVPVFCRAVSEATGQDTRSLDRERAAQTSVLRWRLDAPVTGYATLVSRWKSVADAFDEAMAQGHERQVRELASGPDDAASLPPLEETTQRLEETLRRAPEGLTLIQAGCGLGKTRAAEKIAAERDATAYRTRDAQGLRAPPRSKTSLSVDKHSLALQVVQDLAVLGTQAGRHFGPLSHRDGEGNPSCKFHGVARSLVEGGLSMQWELCEGRGLRPCPHAASCPAKVGYDGPDNPRVRVGPHALMNVLDRAAGLSGMLVLDEPPPPLETLVFSPGDLENAARMQGAFDGVYAACLMPLVEVMRVWLERGTETGVGTDIAAVVRQWGRSIALDVLEEGQRWAREPTGDPLTCAMRAPVSEERGLVPPVRWEWVEMARTDESKARRLGQAARVLGALHQAAVTEAPVVVRLEPRGRARSLHLTRAREEFVKAIQRTGPVVVLDANVDLWAPVYEKIVGYPLPLHRFHAPDGAPVERMLLRLRSATRSAWQPGGIFTVASSLVTAVRAAIDWALLVPGNGVLALLSMPLTELALRAAWAPEDAALPVRWAALGQPPETMAEARQVLGPLLARWKGTILFGHYGALRGLDAMAGADTLVTMGDPWVNLGEVYNDCHFLGLQGWEQRYEAMCRAELEQAHGRLRTVHRTRPARAMHIGRVLPGGPLWSGPAVKVVRIEQETIRARTAMTTEEFAAVVTRLGGVRAASRELGLEPGAVSRLVRGERAVSTAVAATVRDHLDRPMGTERTSTTIGSSSPAVATPRVQKTGVEHGG